jgi:hypothetical protein
MLFIIRSVYDNTELYSSSSYEDCVSYMDEWSYWDEAFIEEVTLTN